MEYRRAFIPGGSFFFTLVTEKRCPLFDNEHNVDVPRQAFRNVKEKRPFDIEAIVIMPDHLHSIWTLPPENADFSTRWRLIKTWFGKHCSADLRVNPDQARQNKNQQAVWQHRFWEHALRDETDFTRHLEYIHYNPVKHGYVGAPKDWQYSSFHRYVRAGTYPAAWGTGTLDFEGIGHE
ncbi:REP-associated tyrosine transposase [Candidatus Thiosymbion oneisti]|uniref:REP-associated tyrosine transposase n=1 Tax=Candidatus Thiosymbion oneisti TaxID=589554 RepID=UPI000A827F29|nr:transposase [Candidatus Thiosymbion oneisti]